MNKKSYLYTGGSNDINYINFGCVIIYLLVFVAFGSILII